MAGAVIVATWNLENLLRSPSGAGPTGQQAYEDKLGELARVIGELGPDVLGVQEIGGPEPLDNLRERLGGEWHAASSELPDGRGIRVGFLSRLAVEDVAHVGDFPEQLRPVQVSDDGDTIDAMGRGALRVRVRAEGRNVDVVNCHLKSKLLTFPGGRFHPRRGRARARRGLCALSPGGRGGHRARLRQRAAGGAGGRACGHRAGRSQRRARGGHHPILLGPPGSEIDTAGFERPDQGDAWRLWSLAPLIAEQRRSSRRFRGHGELIDHILVSHALAQAVEHVDTRAEEPPSITEDPTERRDEPASDHLPVVARFRLE